MAQQAVDRRAEPHARVAAASPAVDDQGKGGPRGQGELFDRVASHDLLDDLHLGVAPGAARDGLGEQPSAAGEALVGSVGMTVAGRVEVPVVLVRARGAGVPDGPVVAGLDLRRPCDKVPSFAFGEAARRRTSVHALYVQRLPVHALPGPPVGPDVRPAVAPEVAASLDEALEPWRAAYPEVAAEGRVVIGSAGQEVVRAAADASLVVVGRRARRSAPGAHIGGVAYAVLHHGRAPVALVPHG